MRYKKPEIHPYKFITDIETSASTLTTVNIDVNAAINRINEENSQAGKDSARGEVFSFEF